MAQLNFVPIGFSGQFMRGSAVQEMGQSPSKLDPSLPWATWTQTYTARLTNATEAAPVIEAGGFSGGGTGCSKATGG